MNKSHCFSIVRSKYVETTPELWYGVLQHIIFIDDTDMMTKVKGFIDILKYFPIYTNMTLYMWAHVGGKDKILTFATIINNIVFSCIINADINNGL